MPAAAQEEGRSPVGYRPVLADPSVRVLLAAFALSAAAGTLRTVALALLVYDLTGSPLLSALTYGVAFLPQCVGGLLLGGVADRARPRPLIAGGHFVDAVAGVALALGDLSVGAMLVTAAVVGAIEPVFAGSSSRLIADTLVGDAYVLGRSLFAMASSAAQLAGLAGGGVAVYVLGVRGALGVTAAAHLACALLVGVCLPDLPAPREADPGKDRPDGPNQATTHHRSLMARTWTANLALVRDTHIRALLAAQWLPPTFAIGAESLVIPYAGAAELPAGTAALMLACLPLGMIVGDLTVARLLRPRIRERLLTPLLCVLGTPLLGFAYAPGPVLGAALLAVSGMGFAYALTVQRRFRDAVPRAVRGQAFGLLATGLMTLQGVGPALFGALAHAVPIHHAMAAAGAAVLLTTLCLRPRLRPPP